MATKSNIIMFIILFIPFAKDTLGDKMKVQLPVLQMLDMGGNKTVLEVSRSDSGDSFQARATLVAFKDEANRGLNRLIDAKGLVVGSSIKTTADGEKKVLAARSKSNLFSNKLFVSTPENELQRIGPSDGNVISPAISPDGTKIAYYYSLDTTKYLGPMALFICNSDGSEICQISPYFDPFPMWITQARVPYPNWSSNSEKVIFQAQNNGQYGNAWSYDISVLDLKAVPLGCPCSFNSKGDLFGLIAQGDSYGIYKWNDIKNVFVVEGVDPLVTPDGNYLFYLSMDRKSIFIIDLEQGDEGQLIMKSEDMIHSMQFIGM